MEDIVGVAASAAGGGVFGLIGTALGRVVGFFERRQSIAHEERRWAHEANLLSLKRAADAEAFEAEHKIKHTEASWNGLQASILADSELASGYAWVDAVRGLTRPSLALLLWLISTFIWLGSDAQNRQDVAEAATFAATAATLWWFGDRGRSQKG